MNEPEQVVDKVISHNPGIGPAIRITALIRSRPYPQMRYTTLGDYYRTRVDAPLVIDVAALPDWRYEFLVALHELVEEALTRHRGIPEPLIRAFDEAHPDSPDPGAEPDAPYRIEHLFASAVEFMVARELGVDWAAYERACEEVQQCAS